MIPKSTLREDLQRTVGDSSLPQGLVTFVVGRNSKRFEHISKCLLCVRSEYFSHMFRSGMRETSASEIRIEDVKPKAFGWLLKYLISDVIEWNSTNTEDMIDVFHLARYFGVQRLEKMTRRDIEDNLTFKNAISVRSSLFCEGFIVLPTNYEKKSIRTSASTYRFYKLQCNMRIRDYSPRLDDSS